MKVIIIHLGEPSYLYGLVGGLSKIEDLHLIVIGSDRSLNLLNKYSNVEFRNFRGSQSSDASFTNKLKRNLKYYLSSTYFIIRSDAKIVHIEWFNKNILLESTFLIWIYKLFGKKIIFTAHNVNQDKRDKRHSYLNFLINKGLYSRVKHIIVHNNYSKREMISDFNIVETKISVNKLGLNMQVPKAGVTQTMARKCLSLSSNEKVILFFGGLNPYKGVDLLIDAFQKICLKSNEYLLIIAGEVRNKSYVKELKDLVNRYGLDNKVRLITKFIPDNEVENYFAAADCLVLPYRHIYQSGLHVLSYSFGLPVIATDVGSFKDEDIKEEETGFICKPNNVDDLKYTILKYFGSDIFTHLAEKRKNIMEWARINYSWEVIGINTYNLYRRIDSR